MRRYSLSTFIATALTLVVSLVATSGAQAGVVTDQNNGHTYGVTLVPGTSLASLPNSVTPVTTNVQCLTPPPARVNELPDTGLCYHGGAVLHNTETFAVVWNLFSAGEPHSDYAAPYVEQFLRDVADSGRSGSSPYAVASQYTQNGQVATPNGSLYGGGYTDNGSSQTAVSSDCTPTGPHTFSQGTNSFVDILNDACVTDAQIRTELGQMITTKQLWRTQSPDYKPLLVFLTPPGVETCLDDTGTVCSTNSDLASQNAASDVTAQFCSYHSQLTVNGSVYNYVVQPWSAGTEAPGSGCDEPDTTAPPSSGAIDPHQLATDMGARLVSPLSQASIAAITNPGFDGWYANDGAEINDNGCVGLGLGLDQVSVGGTSYYLQREFNNAGMMVDNPFALPCAPSIGLEPSFVVPSPIDAGDVVEFDGAGSPSTLIVPDSGYKWDFGDGTTAVGPSAAHSYAHGGTFTAVLTVTDRGGYVASSSQQVVVIGPPASTTPSISLPTSQPAHSSGAKPALSVRVALMPQGLKGVLRSGVALNVTSNQSANGILTLSIPRSAAKRAHIRTGHGPAVVIGRGTLSGIHSGSNHLHIHLPKATATKLKRLGHVTLTIRLSLVAQGGHRITVDAAGHY